MISDQTRSITPLQTFGLTRMSHRACTACHLLMPGTQSPGSHQAWCHLLLRQAAKRAVRPERATKGRSALTSSSTMPISPCSSTISTYSSFIITNSNSFYSTNNRSVAKLKAESPMMDCAASMHTWVQSESLGLVFDTVDKTLWPYFYLLAVIWLSLSLWC